MDFSAPFGGVIPGAQGAVLSALLRTDLPLTGRQVHGLVSDRHSLWSVQEALKALTQLGVVDSRILGRTGIHTINEAHAAVAPLRALVDPLGALKAEIAESVDDDVRALLLFGSIARGEAHADSDIDLAVIADAAWGGRMALVDLVHGRTGNDCDVLVFTAAEFDRLSRAGEPVVAEILRDGVALVGTKPQRPTGSSR